MYALFLERVAQVQPQLLTDFFRYHQKLLQIDLHSPLEDELARVYPDEWEQAEKDIGKAIASL